MENTNETITNMESRSIKLSDYKKGFISVFANTKAHNTIKVDLKIVLKKQTNTDFIASVAK